MMLDRIQRAKTLLLIPALSSVTLLLLPGRVLPRRMNQSRHGSGEFSGEVYVTPATLDGSWVVRVSIGSLTTERDHVADLWRLMRRLAADL